MSKQHLFIILMLLCAGSILCQQSPQEKYIEKFRDIAIREMERSGVPASIKLGQGILESASGQSVLATKANNHFGMKCGKYWKGREHYREDDDYDANGKLIKSCFRAYDNAEECFIAHSEFLLGKSRYAALFRLDVRDYKGWAYGLKNAGYATSKTYAQKLIKVIEANKLYEYDLMSSDNLLSDVVRNKIIRNNDVKMVYAKNTQTVADVADAFNVKVKKILKYNETLSSGSQKLEDKEPVYLQCKRRNYRGDKKYHYLKKGETMLDVAMEYGLRLDKLQKKNRIEAGMEPEAGAKIKLRGFKVKKDDAPKTRKERKSKANTKDKKKNNKTDNKKDDDEFLFGDDDDDTDYIEKDPSDPKVPGSGKQDDIAPEDDLGNTPGPGDLSVEYYMVQKGETLYGISRKFNVSINKLKQLNRIQGDVIFEGQRLRVK